MNVKSMARVKYSYNLDGINLTGVSTSNIVNTEVRKMSLLARKFSSSDYFKSGDIMTYNIVLSNTGTSKTNNIILDDSLTNQEFLPSSIKFYLLNDDTQFDITYEVDNNTLSLHIPYLNAQDICVISYKTIMGANVNLIKGEMNLSSDEVAKQVLSGSELKQGFAKIECLKKVNDTYTYLNTNLTYELTLRNTGNISAYNVEVFDELPSTYELNEDTPVTYKGEALNYEFTNNILSFVIPEVPSASELTVLVNGRIVS